MNETICWKCKKACGGCFWSRCLKPVNGWDATPTKIINHTGNITEITDSFKVNRCPQFVKER